ncbi:hypothetical protein ACFQ9U_34080 [Streptomyces sp. NPDC056568]|uniref:hypothetical protein n=1 Tax=Streptomyces sp. NPDC056568 TaxID=3345866 RepID=UPI0036C8F103
MPRGRHRHSPPLHRLLPPSAIAGVSLVCALGPWVFSEAMILRSLAAAAAVTAVGGAVVMRHWDAQAGRRVADLTRARASDEWRYEERVAELESDLEESRELRVKLEHRLRAKRTELAGLRNEHAALLRRYATAETERASALEGRRLLEIEAVPPARALPAARTASAAEVSAGGARASAGGARASAGGAPLEGEAPTGGTPVGEGEEGGEAAEEAPAVFSPEGSRLFLRANAALARLDEDAPAAPDAADRDGDGDSEDGGGGDGDGGGNGGGERAAAAESAQADEAPGQPAAGGHEHTAAASPTAQPGRPEQAQEPERPEEQTDERPEQSGERGVPSGDRGERSGDRGDRGERSERSGEPSAQPRQATRQATGHFTVPTAVAVVPTAPVRRPVVEGGFDFFGTADTEEAADAEDGRAPSDTLEAVQNEDLADVVGQEALALHKAEAEAAFKPAGEETRGVGQVIDLTAHDETEQIDVQGLRSAVS